VRERRLARQAGLPRRPRSPAIEPMPTITPARFDWKNSAARLHQAIAPSTFTARISASVSVSNSSGPILGMIPAT
jgi:hypothetical protein